MKSNVKLRPQINDLPFQVYDYCIALSLLVLYSVSVYGLIFCVREVCLLFTDYSFYAGVLYEQDELLMQVYNFFFAAFSILFGVGKSISFLARKPILKKTKRTLVFRRAGTDNSFLLPGFFHTALKFSFGIGILCAFVFSIPVGSNSLIFLISVASLVVFYFNTWNAIIRLFPGLVKKVILGLIPFIVFSVLLGLWYPIDSVSLRKKILKSYIQYQMDIELPTAHHATYFRPSADIPETIYIKNGKMILRNSDYDRSEDIFIQSPYNIPKYRTRIVADKGTPIRNILKMIYEKEPDTIHSVYIAGQPDYSSYSGKTYRKSFQKGYILAMGKDKKSNSLKIIVRNGKYFRRTRRTNDKVQNSIPNLTLRPGTFILSEKKYPSNEFTTQMKQLKQENQLFELTLDEELSLEELFFYLDFICKEHF